MATIYIETQEGNPKLGDYTNTPGYYTVTALRALLAHGFLNLNAPVYPLVTVQS